MNLTAFFTNESFQAQGNETTVRSNVFNASNNDENDVKFSDASSSRCLYRTYGSLSSGENVDCEILSDSAERADTWILGLYMLGRISLDRNTSQERDVSNVISSIMFLIFLVRAE